MSSIARGGEHLGMRERQPVPTLDDAPPHRRRPVQRVGVARLTNCGVTGPDDHLYRNAGEPLTRRQDGGDVGAVDPQAVSDVLLEGGGKGDVFWRCAFRAREQRAPAVVTHAQGEHGLGQPRHHEVEHVAERAELGQNQRKVLRRGSRQPVARPHAEVCDVRARYRRERRDLALCPFVAHRFPHRDAAPVVREHVDRLVGADRIDHGHVVTGQLRKGEVPVTLRVRRLAVAAIVDGDDVEALGEERRHTVPQVVRVGPAVQQQDGLARWIALLVDRDLDIAVADDALGDVGGLRRVDVPRARSVAYRTHTRAPLRPSLRTGSTRYSRYRVPLVPRCQQA